MDPVGVAAIIPDMIRVPTLIAVLAIALATPAVASAWVRTLTCDDTGVASPFTCLPDEEPRPVFWPDACVLFYLNENGSADVPDRDAVIAEIVASFDAWNALDCNYLTMQYAGLSTELPGLTPDGFANGNVIYFVESNWRHSSGIHALTSVSYDPTTAYIADVDMEINGAGRAWGIIPDGVEDASYTDLRNVITHEAGHFLGLEHTPIVEATMYAASPNGDVSRRSLEPDDIDGACSVYPAERAPSDLCGCEQQPDGTWFPPPPECVDNSWRVDELPRSDADAGGDAGMDAGSDAGNDVGLDAGTGGGSQRGCGEECGAGGSTAPSPLMLWLGLALFATRRRTVRPARS